MKIYRVTVNDIIAEDEEDAFIQAADLAMSAMSGGCWRCDIEEIGEIKDED